MNDQENHPALFGLGQSNRNFSGKSGWGKNIFNNAFPVALTSYMHSLGLSPVYITLDNNLETVHSKIDAFDLFNHDPLAGDIFYAFESLYTPYEQFVANYLPRIDLVSRAFTSSDMMIADQDKRGLEIKLTALPDNSTAELTEEHWGSELVIRPDTVVYLALSIATNYFQRREQLGDLVLPVSTSIKDWSNPSEIADKLTEICNTIDSVLLDSLDMQKPLLLQPIWKSKGKTLELEDYCLDAFVWSDYGFTRLFIDNLQRSNNGKITRPIRACVWLLRMLHDFVEEGKIDHQTTMEELNFGLQTDKAFAVNGSITNGYLASSELLQPRVQKEHLSSIILNGGEKMLSPERRFDAAVLSNAYLFD